MRFRPCKKWYLYSQCDEKPLLSNRSINYTFPAKENAYPASSAVLEFSSRDQLGKYVTNNSAQSQRVKFAREYWIIDKYTSPYAVDDLFWEDHRIQDDIHNPSEALIKSVTQSGQTVAVLRI